MASILDHVSNITENTVTAQYSPSYLNKVYYVVKSNYVPPLESFDLTLSAASVEVGASVTASLSNFVPDSYDETGAVYSTSDETLATVDETGEVTTIAAGSIDVIATIGDVTASAPLTITAVEVPEPDGETEGGTDGEAEPQSITVTAKSSRSTPFTGNHGVYEVTSSDDISNYTDDKNAQGFFDGGLNSVFFVVVDDISDLESISAIDSTTAYTFVLSPDFTYAEYAALNIAFGGITLYYMASADDVEFNALERVGGYQTLSYNNPDQFIGLTYAVGQQLSQSNFTNLQYISAPYLDVGGVNDLAIADQAFDNRSIFYFNDSVYGNRLAGWFVGGLPITYYLIKETINYYLKQGAFTWTADNQPTNTINNRLALQNYLNKTVINYYVDLGYLDEAVRNTLQVVDDIEVYFVDIRAEYVIPNPIWRYNVTIQNNTAE